jgi:hypothetical protein
MNIRQALTFLAQHQPMPSDQEVTENLCDTFVECMQFLKKNPEPKSVVLLINTVSEYTGLGMYEMISDVLLKQERTVVLFALKKALNQGNDAVKYRSCWWAIDLNAWCLFKEISALVNSCNTDLSDAAKSYVELRRDYV